MTNPQSSVSQCIFGSVIYTTVQLIQSELSVLLTPSLNEKAPLRHRSRNHFRGSIMCLLDKVIMKKQLTVCQDSWSIYYYKLGFYDVDIVPCEAAVIQKETFYIN